VTFKVINLLQAFSSEIIGTDVQQASRSQLTVCRAVFLRKSPTFLFFFDSSTGCWRRTFYVGEPTPL